MKFLRKNPWKLSNLIVFTGYLLSCSILTYQPITHLTGISPILWLFIAALITISFGYGYRQYLTTNHCSFILQIGEYILLPLAAFTLIQQISLSKIQNNQAILVQGIFAIQILMFICILAMVIIKINFINQIFPNQDYKDILLFSKLTRFIRVIKICAISFSLFFLSETQHFILLIFANILEFVIIYTRITFIRIQIERVLLLAALNDLFSLMCYFLRGQHDGFLFVLPQIVLIIFYFLEFQPIQTMIQFKYVHEFKKIFLNENDFEDSRTKCVIMLVLQCFSEIYKLEYQAILIQKQQAKYEYSENFRYEVKKIYEFIILFYLEHLYVLDVELLKDKLLSSRSDIRNRMKSNVKINHNQMSQKPKVMNQIVENKTLFLNFVAFCMDKLHQNIGIKHFPWSESNQFFLTYTLKLNKNYVIKKLKFHQMRLTLVEQPLLYQARHGKVYNYIRNFKKYYEMNQTHEQDYIMFEKSLDDLKTKMKEISHLQTEFIEKINNPLIKVYEYQQNLVNKQNKKNEIMEIFERCFENPYYLHFDEFTFLFLIFFIIYCKFVTKTVEKVKEKFVSKKKIYKFNEIGLMEKPIVVCSGWQNHRDKVGDILLSNMLFRKNFGFSNLKNPFTSRTICEMIPNNQQNFHHLYLMSESGKFSDFQRKKVNHSDYQCFLKINLQTHKFNLFKQFTVSTHLILCYDQSLMYSCCLDQKNDDIYMSDEQYGAYISKESASLMSGYKDSITHTQLNQEMKLLKVNDEELEQIGIQYHAKQQYVNTETQKDAQNEEFNMRQKILCEQDHKFAKIESVLWSKELSFQRKLLTRLAIALFTFLLGMGCCIGVSYFSQSRSNSAMTVVNEFSNMMTATQGCQMRMSFYLYLILKMETGVLDKDTCSGIDIPDLDSYLRSISHVCIGDRINNYFINYYNNELKIIPVFDPHFIDNIGITSEIPSDYSNYIWKVGTIAMKYLQLNLTQLSLLEKHMLHTFIRQHMSIDNQSISFNLVSSISKQITYLLQRIKLQFHSLVSLAYFVITISFTISIVFSFLMFIEYMKYPQLLTKISRSYFIQRYQEINFIIKEIQKTYDYNLKKITFTGNEHVKIQQNTHSSSKQYEVNLSQFDKLVKIEENKEQVVELNHKNISLLRNVLEFKKYLLTFIIISCILMLALTGVIGNVNGDIINNTFFIRQVVTEGSITKQTLLEMNFILWMAYNMESQITNDYQNHLKFLQANQYLKDDKFFLLLYTNLKEKTLEQTVYVQICEMIQKYNPGNISYELCLQQLGSMSQYSTDELLGIMTKQQYDTWDSILDKQYRYSAEKICKNMAAILTYVVSAIVATMKSVALNLNINNYEILAIIQVFLYFIAVISFIVVAVQYIKVYFRLICVIKFEVLTMDSPKNLYENPQFKPYLNRLYFKHLA